METKDQITFQQLRIAGLHTISFFGYVLHIAIHAILAPGMDKAMLDETAKMMKEPSAIIMMIVFTVFTILPPFFSYIFKNKTGWKIITIIGTISVVLNGLHACLHALQGDIMNGITTFLIQVPPAVIAVILSFKLLKKINN